MIHTILFLFKVLNIVVNFLRCFNSIGIFGYPYDGFFFSFYASIKYSIKFDIIFVKFITSSVC